MLKNNNNNNCITNLEDSNYDSGVVFIIDEIFTRIPLRPIGLWLNKYIKEEKINSYIVIVGYNNRKNINFIENLEYIQLNPNEDYPIFELKILLNFPIITILFSTETSRLFKLLDTDTVILMNTGMKIEDTCNKFANSINIIYDKYLIRFTADTVNRVRIKNEIRFNENTNEIKTRLLPIGCSTNSEGNDYDNNYTREKDSSSDEENDDFNYSSSSDDNEIIMDSKEEDINRLKDLCGIKENEIPLIIEN